MCARARGLGVDGHVCEVILALQRMAPSQNAEVQKRYLRFRKARSERDRLMACLAWHRRVVQACAGGRHWWERESAQQQQHDQSPGGTMHGFFDVEGGGGSHEPWQLEEDEELDEEEVEAQQRLWAGVAGDVREQCRSAMWKVVVGRQLGGEPGKVERRAENMYEAVAKASTSSVLSMPRPIAAMLCKPIFVCLATLAAGGTMMRGNRGWQRFCGVVGLGVGFAMLVRGCLQRRASRLRSRCRLLENGVCVTCDANTSTQTCDTNNAGLTWTSDG